MRRHALIMGLGSLCFATGAGGCLFEAGLVDALNKDPTPTPTAPPVVSVPGAITVTATGTFTVEPVFHLYDAYGEEIPVTQAATATPGAYLLTAEDATQLTSGTLRITATAGNIVLKAVVACLTQDDLDTGVLLEMDADSTAVALVIDALGAFRGDSIDNPAVAPYSYMLQTFSTDELALAADNLLEALEDPASDVAAFASMVSAVVAAGDETVEGPAMFPLVSTGPHLLQSDFLASVAVDFDADGSPDTDPALFDEAAIALAGQQQQAILTGVPLDVYTDSEGGTHPYLVTVFTAHMEDGTCIQAENACSGQWINCDEGDSLYFTGGTHEDSPIQDVAFDAMMGDWTPNTIPMYDDGTHGDIVPEDGIYTIVFLFPEGLRIGYKYTYGSYGQNWTSTEEWPGNQRILEIVDLNGDGIVWRDDYVTNETTNKDKNNCHSSFEGCNGTITWDTDLNGDGIPEAQEHPLSVSVVDEENDLVELAGQCTYDQWLRHPLVTRATAGLCGGADQGAIVVAPE